MPRPPTGTVRQLAVLALLITACQTTPPSTSPPAPLPEDGATAAPRPTAPQRPTDPLPPADGAETRALWSWAVRDARSRADIDQLIARLDRAHLNVVLALVYYRGTAYFEPSRTRFSDAERLPNKSRFKDDEYADALEYLVALRDARRADADPFNDFEVHAWFAVHQGGHTDNTQPAPEPDLTQPYMLNALFPEFRLKLKPYYAAGDRRYVDHGVSVIQQPKFRAYISNLIAGVIEDYHLDGAHLDYIRTGSICFNDDVLDYPGTDFDYPGCQADYRAWTQATYGWAYDLMLDTTRSGQIADGGSGRVAAWLEYNVGLLVQTIQAEVKAASPRAVLSAAVGVTSPDPVERRESRNGQAAWEWLDRGWIDAAFVMAYTSNTEGALRKTQRFINAVEDPDSRSRIFPGLAVYDEELGPWSSLVADQVEAVTGRRAGAGAGTLQPPARGLALFVDRHFSTAAADSLAAGPFSQPARPFWGE